MDAVGYVVPSWSPTRLADGQIALRTMSWSIDTMTVWATAALVGLDQRAAQHLFDRRQVFQCVLRQLRREISDQFPCFRSDENCADATRAARDQHNSQGALAGRESNHP